MYIQTWYKTSKNLVEQTSNNGLKQRLMPFAFVRWQTHRQPFLTTTPRISAAPATPATATTAAATATTLTTPDDTNTATTTTVIVIVIMVARTRFQSLSLRVELTAFSLEGSKSRLEGET
jgi:hypothetical protein